MPKLSVWFSTTDENGKTVDNNAIPFYFAGIIVGGVTLMCFFGLKDVIVEKREE